MIPLEKYSILNYIKLYKIYNEDISNVKIFIIISALLVLSEGKLQPSPASGQGQL